ncbi:hypothetical protein BDQ12DRAFT_728965 [Crucibulum laeve]|uniref:Uncharacterized protein n=1 Tax=Crucibulum laeve TaxID=68775 RepID=A0A5C3LIS3_9AGAR|nr:hypothetical protein BDQ12DRAFT_728965 [Crucibulum laeve]
MNLPLPDIQIATSSDAPTHSPPDTNYTWTHLKIERIENEILRPAMIIFWDAYERSPVIAIFIATSVLLAFVPTVAFVSVTVFHISASVFLAFIGAIASIFLLETVNLVGFILVLAVIFVISAIVTAFLIFGIKIFHITTQYSLLFRNLQSYTMADWVSIPSQIGTHVQQNWPHWWKSTQRLFSITYTWIMTSGLKDILLNVPTFFKWIALVARIGFYVAQTAVFIAGAIIVILKFTTSALLFVYTFFSTSLLAFYSEHFEATAERRRQEILEAFGTSTTISNPPVEIADTGVQEGLTRRAILTFASEQMEESWIEATAEE